MKVSGGAASIMGANDEEEELLMVHHGSGGGGSGKSNGINMEQLNSRASSVTGDSFSIDVSADTEENEESLQHKLR